MSNYIILKKVPRKLREPMLAGKQPPDWTREQYLDFISKSGPYITQPKEDGVRFMKLNSAVSRKFKPIPNDFIRNFIERDSGLPYGSDGEIRTLDAEGNPLPFHDVQSDVMTYLGEPRFYLAVFDYAPHEMLDETFDKRYNQMFLRDAEKRHHLVRTFHLQQHLIQPDGNVDAILAIEKEYTQAGYEGVIFRHPHAKYKCGRSTLDEGHLLALTHWQTSEAKILDFYELEHNDNRINKDAFGRTKRSSERRGRRAGNTLGGMVVQDIKTGVTFKIGSGFTEPQRQEIWEYKNLWTGGIITYKYKPYGQKDKPRTPIYLGRRFDLL